MKRIIIVVVLIIIIVAVILGLININSDNNINSKITNEEIISDKEIGIEQINLLISKDINRVIYHDESEDIDYQDDEILYKYNDEEIHLEYQIDKENNVTYVLYGPIDTELNLQTKSGLIDIDDLDPKYYKTFEQLEDKLFESVDQITSEDFIAQSYDNLNVRDNVLNFKDDKSDIDVSIYFEN